MLKGEMRKQAILDAAQAQFFEKGYMGTSIQNILDALDCSKGSFYHHFESKLQVLSALCRQHAQAGLDAFEETAYGDMLSRLNGLLYFSMPFRADSEKLLALILPLYDIPEGDVVLGAMSAAHKELFYPEISRALRFLRAEGVVHYPYEDLPQLLWDAHTAIYHKLMRASAALLTDIGALQTVMPVLHAARFMWERLLDAPFGSIEIVRGEEAMTTIQHAVAYVKKYRESRPAIE